VERNEKADSVLLLLLSRNGAALPDDSVVTPPQLVPSYRVDPFWPKTLPKRPYGMTHLRH
jgi:hypothetical protein